MKIVTLLLISCLIFSPLKVAAYYFATDVETKVIDLSSDKVTLKVIKHDDKDDEDVYPIGTKLYGNFFQYNTRRHFLKDEYLKVHLHSAQLPNGRIEVVDKDIKIKPRVFFSAQHGGAGLAGTLGLVLKLTIDPLTVGFPVGRGAKAISDAAFHVYNTPSKESRWKQGAKGFVKGILFPLPELFLKGERLPIHDESHIWIQDAKQHKHKLTAFVIKRKNIYLDEEKYYAATGREAPDFSKHLKSNKEISKSTSIRQTINKRHNIINRSQYGN